MTRHLLANIYLFDQLADDELAQVDAIAETTLFNANARIFDQGEAGDALYVIKYGSVQIRHRGQSDDMTMVVRTLGSGSHFGEMSLIDEEMRSAGAVVLEPSEILVIRYDGLLALLDVQPTIAVKFYRAIARYLSGRLRQTTADLGFARDRSLHSV